MKKISFNTSTAQKIYEQYLKRANKAAKILSKEDRNDIMLEINSHIYEAMEHKQAMQGGEEADNLLVTLEALGEPREFLKPQIAEKKLKQATQTFNPLHVFQALMLNIRNGIAFILVGFLYLFMFSFIWVFIAKLVQPDKVGWFTKDGDFVAIGHFTGPIEPGVQEVMGYWILPLCVLIMLVLYLINTAILKFISK